MGEQWRPVSDGFNRNDVRCRVGDLSPGALDCEGCDIRERTGLGRGGPGWFFATAVMATGALLFGGLVWERARETGTDGCQQENCDEDRQACDGSDHCCSYFTAKHSECQGGGCGISMI